MKKRKIPKIKQKIIIAVILILLIFNFIMPNYSQADFGGDLLTPICDILAAVGDSINWLMLKAIGEGNDDVYLNGTNSYIGLYYNNKWFNKNKNEANISKKTLVFSKGESQQVNAYDEEYIGYIGVPNIQLSPVDIFANKVALLDANFFKDTSDGTQKEYDEEMLGGHKSSVIYNIKDTIANWYNTFRLIAIVGLLSVLIYLGIRIILSSIASDKAKYKQMLEDWLVALCLVFFLHYIMAFTMTMVDTITSSLAGVSEGSTIKEVFVTVVNTDGKVVNIDASGSPSSSDQFSADWQGGFWSKFGGSMSYIKNTVENFFAGGANMPVVYATNLEGYIRALVENPTGIKKITYTNMYLILTFITLAYFFIYLKRLITLIFLTIIAPLVALTYPIDKVKDGKAQAFDYWLKEYLANAMLPIIHLILYKVLVTTSIELASTMPLYAIIVLCFMFKAEGMVKEMFGIQSKTAPSASDLVGANLAANALSSVAKKVGGIGSKALSGANSKIRNANLPSESIGGSGVDALAEKYHTEDEATLDNSKIGGAADNSENGAREYYNTMNDEEDGEYNYTPEMMDSDIEEQDLPNTNPNSNLNERTQLKHPKLANAGMMARRLTRIPKGRTLQELAMRSAKTGLRAAAIIGTGSLGLATGAATGNGLKGFTAGISAGNIMKNGIANAAEIGVRGAIRGRNEIQYGEKEAELMDSAINFDMGYEARAHLQKKLSEEGYEGTTLNEQMKMRMREYGQYNRQGITDLKEMDALHDIKDEMIENNVTEDLATRKTLELAELSKDYQKSDFLDHSKAEHIGSSINNKFKNAGLSESGATNATDSTMDYLGRIKGVKNTWKN